MKIFSEPSSSSIQTESFSTKTAAVNTCVGDTYEHSDKGLPLCRVIQPRAGDDDAILLPTRLVNATVDEDNRDLAVKNKVIMAGNSAFKSNEMVFVVVKRSDTL